MASKFRLFTKRFFIFTNLLVVFFFLLACIAPYLDPQKYWFISVLGLAFPFLLIHFWLQQKGRYKSGPGNHKLRRRRASLSVPIVRLRWVWAQALYPPLSDTPADYKCYFHTGFFYGGHTFTFHVLSTYHPRTIYLQST